MKKYAVIDLDGTLFDDRHRHDLLPKGDGPFSDADYHEYHQAMYGDVFINSGIIETSVEKMHLVFVTARPEVYRKSTFEMLKKYFLSINLNLSYLYGSALIMRPNGNGLSAHILKPMMLDAHLRACEARFSDVGLAVDDRSDVLTEYVRAGVPPENAWLALPHEWIPFRLAEEVSGTIEGFEGVAGQIHELLKTFAARAEEYPATRQPYETFGAVMKALYPEGLALEPEEFERFGVFVQVVHKLTRYASTLAHYDSAHDLALYAAILATVTADGKE